jgi:peptide/nickel transport system permease protein
MPGFIARRLVALVPVVIGASVFAFALAQIAPGDVTSVLLGPYATAEQRDALRQELALDQPAPVQYLHWLGNAVQGDLGTSIQLQQPVTDVLSTKFSATLLLGGTSFAIALVFGIGAGLVSALRYRRPIDRGVQAAVGFLAFMPVFWLGVLLIYVMSVRLGWLPAGGMEPVGGGGDPLERARYLILPALATAGIPAAIIARSARAAFHEQLRSDFMRTARAKGLSRWTILTRHLWRATMPAILHVAGLQLAYLLVGSIVFTEVVFNWPGIGLQVFNAVSSRDLPMIQGVVLLAAIITVAVNLLVDVLHALVDPRTREPAHA